MLKPPPDSVAIYYNPMKIINTTIDDDEGFTCPASGELVLTEGDAYEGESSATKAIWHSSDLENPRIDDPQIEKAWNEQLAGNYGMRWEELEEFLGQIDIPHYETYCVSTPGPGCSSGFTDWLVIDMNYKKTDNK